MEMVLEAELDKKKKLSESRLVEKQIGQKK